MHRIRSRVVVACGLVLVAGAVAGCGRGAAPHAETAASDVPRQSVGGTAITPTSATASATTTNPMVVLHTSAGDITIELLTDKAPRTVENFLRGYAERGFYEQTIFHHVEPGQMLIGGGYTSDFQRKERRAPIYNESRNGLSNRRGTVAMIRDPDAPHSATSEFFFNLADNSDFDFRTAGDEDVPGYCVFGQVVGGLNVVDGIAQQPTTSQGDFVKIPSPAVTINRVERLH